MLGEQAEGHFQPDLLNARQVLAASHDAALDELLLAQSLQDSQ